MEKGPEGEVQIGQKAPGFTLPASNGEKISLSQYRGKKGVVLYFYPKDDTPGCTREACDFRDYQKEFGTVGAVIVGVSCDGVTSHKKFMEKYQIPFPLLSDEGGEVSRAYGVYGKKTLYGREFWGIIRSTFIIDRKGTVKKIYRNVKVKKHVPEIMEYLRSADFSG